MHDDDDLLRIAAAMGQQIAVAVVERVLAAAHLDEAQRDAVCQALAEQGGAGVGGTAVFRRRGDFWALQYDGHGVLVRHCRGLLHLSRLLAQPGTPVHVLDLVLGDGAQAGHHDDDRPRTSESSLGPVLDATAKSAYRRRLRELADELDEARARSDGLALDRLELEREHLVRELSRALGLGGRDRVAGSPVERARVAVTKGVRGTIARIGQHHEPLGEHLRRTVRTGTFCCYEVHTGPAWAV